ncbi:hypothetical protein [Reinekea blandensis]|uniref:Sugar phosphate isomerase/epimerase n=1 Tax=Reinekea blandensis MED297 TaxID=314283 RepID=A4BIF6_9GAMM|nr:hypothetical protein [Reinekea blandensis]EAR08035.1 hypothetical protein MED297_07326 [Reinekea sp. MED297] [Reinekea blandensis MED297]
MKAEKKTMTFQLSKVIGASALAIILGAASGQVLAESGRTTDELPIAVQMWTMRNAGNIDAQLAYIEAAGITSIETFGRAGDLSAKDYKKKLDAHGIEVISHHEGIDSLRSDVDAVIDM